jgi:hypothetical protein
VLPNCLQHDRGFFERFPYLRSSEISWRRVRGKFEAKTFFEEASKKVGRLNFPCNSREYNGLPENRFQIENSINTCEPEAL